MLKGLQQAVESRSEFKFSKKRHVRKATPSAASPIFSQEFKKRLEDDNFELSALRIGQLLERNSLAFYGKASKRSRHPELKSLFSYLADWEKDHLRALVQQERYLRGKP